MSLTCAVAALGYLIGYGLIIHGLIGIVDMGNQKSPCGVCIATRSVEVTGGMIIMAGLIAMTGGFL